MKTNYQLETDRVIKSLENTRPKLLLQCCCGPCGSYVLEYICKHFHVTALFYNPNIYPPEEYEKRLHWLERVLEKNGVERLDCPYDPAAFETAASGFESEPEGGARCTQCFRLRLEETARLASVNGFDYFCTTLTVSPHKDAERINAIGRELGEKYSVAWLPSDFKKRDGYKRSIELSSLYGLYRQSYCGCKYSIREEENIDNEKQI